MGKTLLHRLFGVGKIPQPKMTQFLQEGIILSDEGIKASVTYKNFRAPGRYSLWRRQWFTGCIVLTHVRLAAFAFSSPAMDVPLEDPRLRRLQCAVEGDDTICITFDTSLFQDSGSGTIEYRFTTPQARAFLVHLQEQLA